MWPSLRSSATSSVCRPTDCSRMIFASVVRRAGALPCSDSDLSIFRLMHKVARILHKNAETVKRGCKIRCKHPSPVDAGSIPIQSVGLITGVPMHTLLRLALLLTAMGVAAPAPADEGMWTFDNFPTAKMQAKY